MRRINPALDEVARQERRLFHDHDFLHCPENVHQGVRRADEMYLDTGDQNGIWICTFAPPNFSRCTSSPSPAVIVAFSPKRISTGKLSLPT